ncbi:threonine-phosphate decarboxylase CobD [Aliikangiella sp. IMCC44359]|uniref:threonine-phosphate decarboxylase CobD n=1 Tax=Aliikangiella sp. IMCC44359 TaxID=3459125 RepID=UPI00403B3310
MTLTHGGQLNQVAKERGLSVDGWLDLSTGISPFSYPIPTIPDDIWRSLPQQTEPLLRVAKLYYHANHLMVTNGSQSIIQALPRVWKMQVRDTKQTKVFVPLVGYKEHQKAWQDAGFEVIQYHKLPALENLPKNSIVIVINPNNPTGKLIDNEQLKKLHQHLLRTEGWLIIDEAFMDVRAQSDWFNGDIELGHCIVLRSIGKFFGLAGIRVGFAIASAEILKLCEQLLGVWQVNGPALYLCERALADRQWQTSQRSLLASHAQRLREILSDHFVQSNIGGSDLFVTIKTSYAPEYFDWFCHNKIYVRLCDECDALRFGIPDNSGLQRLESLFLSSEYQHFCESFK